MGARLRLCPAPRRRGARFTGAGLAVPRLPCHARFFPGLLHPPRMSAGGTVTAGPFVTGRGPFGLGPKAAEAPAAGSTWAAQGGIPLPRGSRRRGRVARGRGGSGNDPAAVAPAVGPRAAAVPGLERCPARCAWFGTQRPSAGALGLPLRDVVPWLAVRAAASSGAWRLRDEQQDCGWCR